MVLIKLWQVLFYEDPAPTNALSEKWPIIKDLFPECRSYALDNIRQLRRRDSHKAGASHSTGMHQLARKSST